MTTIKLYNGKKLEQMTDSEKQDLGSKLVRDEFGHCFSNCFSTLFAAIDESHIEYDDMHRLLGSYDYESVVTEHINDLSLSDLYDLIDNQDLDETKEKFHALLVSQLKTYLAEDVHWNWKQGAIDDVFTNYSTDSDYTMQEDETDIHAYMNRAMPKVVEYFSDIDNIIDFMDWVETNGELSDWIGIDLETIQTACLESLSETDYDLENYANENSLDAEFDEAYEHWIVSSWLADKLPNTGDVCGLSIWARYCTGQSIYLDYNIQQLAFDIYSTEVDESEHIKKVDAIKAIIAAAVKPDMVQHIESVILDNTTAYQLCINADGLDYEQRKSLEKRISNNVKKVRNILKSHNINL